VAVKRFSTAQLTESDITRVLDSMSDSHNFLANNEKPIRRIIELLKKNFSRNIDQQQDSKYSLAISKGGDQGERDRGSGGSLEPLGLFLRTSIPFIWRILSAFLPT
jgi:hypothetical protein